ncbi:MULTISPECIES: sulfate ABC transporter substrate-binding protein [Pseudanabaena]|uniref:Sulfate ABC transporter, periplasmic sulfate-binding protein n=2 Tax=Pseudanabaena TaxID=1152 RepID=L8N624_9CYAN|nr:MULTISPECIES: sulfate ABC transporter substrate-binding protein [Pseudanabaena]ELS34589.1 sulfate ABC transporter, periplasmic sulfate-binding protein [Pseudanabaena biceps PCC 7429]MDG3493194.1 sulfate ABC transporter substrate-binding protein [Pseudanabaena catenata USMAC16]
MSQSKNYLNLGKLKIQRISWTNLAAVAAVILSVTLVVVKNVESGNTSSQLFNVSYDPTRELYVSLNEQFIAKYEKETGKHLKIKQSHAGSSYQSRSVIDGSAPADVVTLGLYTDVDALRKQSLIPEAWSKRLPNDSQPYSSTIVFVVRKGNPKNIQDWQDLIQPNVEIVTPDPKTSGNGKLSALSAWGSVIKRGGSEADALAFLTAFYEHTTSLAAGARTSAINFSVEKIGDVHLTWENEAIREVAESKGELQIVYPSASILAQPYVVWVDKNTAQHKNAAEAKAYLEFLFTDQAQETIAKFGYRPINQEILNKYSSQFGQIELFPITLIAKDWDDAKQKFFGDNGIIDRVYKPKAK